MKNIFTLSLIFATIGSYSQTFVSTTPENKNVVLNTKKSIEYVLKNPKWKLSVQSHKFLKIKYDEL